MSQLHRETINIQYRKSKVPHREGIIKMSESEIKIVIVGDCSNWNQRGISSENIPKDIRSEIEYSDLFIFDLEGPIVNPKIKVNGPYRNPFLKLFLKIIGEIQPPTANTREILEVLNLSKKNVACLANNHILDAGVEGINNTITELKENNFYYLGAGKNIDEASKPLIIEINHIKVGILNYNFIGLDLENFGIFYNVFGAKKCKPGANYANKKNILKQVNAISDKVNFLIGVFHMGKQLKSKLHVKKQKFTKNLPFDLIAIHHAHITQKTGSKKVISCGDFLYSYPTVLPPNRKSRIILLNIKKNGSKKINLIETNTSWS